MAAYSSCVFILGLAIFLSFHILKKIMGGKMKLFLFVFSFTLTIILFISGCAGDEGVYKYYRKVAVDGGYSIIGEYPLGPELGNKGESYRFFYNNEGKLTKVDHLVGGKLKEGSFFGNDVARVIIERLEVYEKRSYFDANDIPVRDKYGVFSTSILFDENNNPLSKLNYAKYDEFAEDIYGVAQYSFTTNEKGLVEKVIFYDFSGKRITSQEGGFETCFTYDENGYFFERSYFDSRGNLRENKDGVAVLRRKFDDKGNIVEIRYFNAKDKLTEAGGGVAIIQQKFDEDGNIIESGYLGKNEKLKENNMGVAIMRCKFDAYGNIVEQKYYDSSDELTEGEFYGFAIRQWEYNEDGLLVETRFLDVNGNLTDVINEETAILRMKYDADGDLEQVLRFNKDGNPLEDSLTNVP